VETSLKNYFAVDVGKRAWEGYGLDTPVLEFGSTGALLVGVNPELLAALALDFAEAHVSTTTRH
jgi:hypothetical protein